MCSQTQKQKSSTVGKFVSRLSNPGNFLLLVGWLVWGFLVWYVQLSAKDLTPFDPFEILQVRPSVAVGPTELLGHTSGPSGFLQCACLIMPPPNNILHHTGCRKDGQPVHAYLVWRLLCLHKGPFVCPASCTHYCVADPNCAVFCRCNVTPARQRCPRHIVCYLCSTIQTRTLTLLLGSISQSTSPRHTRPSQVNAPL